MADRIDTMHFKTGGQATTVDLDRSRVKTERGRSGRSVGQEGAAQAIAPFSIKADGVEVAVDGAVLNLRQKTSTTKRRKRKQRPVVGC